MKKIAIRIPVLFWALLFLSFGSFLVSSNAQLSPAVKISSKFVKISSVPVAGGDAETWVYEIVLENSGREDLENLTMKLRTYTYGEFDVDGTPEGDLTFNEESIAVPVLKRNVKLEIKSAEVQLVTSRELRAKDMIEGVWLRLFDSNGNEVGSFTSPSSLARKVKWED